MDRKERVMISFLLGMIVGGFLGIAMTALMDGNSYEDGYRQALEDIGRYRRMKWMREMESNDTNK